MKVIVIGAGIIGSCAAYFLAKKGAEVTIIEGHRPAGGASSATFAWLNAFPKEPDHYYQLNLDGIKHHSKLAKELKADHLLHLDGGLHWANTPEGWQMLEKHYTRLKSWDYNCDHIPTSKISSDFEPALQLDGIDSVIRTPDEGWVEVVPLVAALLTAAQSLGAKIFFPMRVLDVEATDHQVTVTTQDSKVTADMLIVATGPASSQVTEKLGFHLPVKKDPGILIVSRPAAVPLKHVVFAPGVHFRPDSGGRLMIGDGDLRGHLPICQPDEIEGRAATQFRLAEQWVPALRNTPTEAIRVGIRPIPSDGLPVAGWLAPELPVYVLVTHSGVTLGPLLGQLAAREIMDEEDLIALHPYRPDRLLLDMPNPGTVLN